jgi:hypothetical protein
MDGKDKKIFIFVIFLMIVAIGLGVVNTFFGNVTFDIAEVGDGEGPDEIQGDGGCEGDYDCGYGEVCIVACGVCTDHTGCNYDACEGGEWQACCDAGLTCNEYNNCICSGGGGSCFLSGTKISMADGSEKNIEDVKVGDYVIGRDGKAEVYELENPIGDGYYILILVDGTELRVTDEHPIYARNGKEEGWSAIASEKTQFKTSDLNEMDEVRALNGWVSIKEIRYVNEEVQTYNLKSVEGSTFYAAGVLVHNKEDSIPAEGGGCASCYGGCGGCGDGDQSCEYCCNTCSICW